MTDGVRVVVDTSWLSKLGPMTDDMLGRLCEDIAADARRLAPVLTGDLRNSIDVLGVSNGVGRVGAGDASVDYAADVELGTREMAAQPFLGLPPCVPETSHEAASRDTASGTWRGANTPRIGGCLASCAASRSSAPRRASRTVATAATTHRAVTLPISTLAPASRTSRMRWSASGCGSSSAPSALRVIPTRSAGARAVRAVAISVSARPISRGVRSDTRGARPAAYRARSL